jgi:hypothetical protein
MDKTNLAAPGSAEALLLQKDQPLVFFEVCVALVFLTLRRPSRLYPYRPGWAGWRRGIPYTLVTLLLGWWSIPWGPIYTPLVLWTNLSGGRLVTAQERSRWRREIAGP